MRRIRIDGKGNYAYDFDEVFDGDATGPGCAEERSGVEDGPQVVPFTGVSVAGPSFGKLAQLESL